MTKIPLNSRKHLHLSFCICFLTFFHINISTGNRQKSETGRKHIDLPAVICLSGKQYLDLGILIHLNDYIEQFELLFLYKL